MTDEQKSLEKLAARLREIAAANGTTYEAVLKAALDLLKAGKTSDK